MPMEQKAGKPGKHISCLCLQDCPLPARLHQILHVWCHVQLCSICLQAPMVKSSAKLVEMRISKAQKPLTPLSKVPAFCCSGQPSAHWPPTAFSCLHCHCKLYPQRIGWQKVFLQPHSSTPALHIEVPLLSGWHRISLGKTTALYTKPNFSKDCRIFSSFTCTPQVFAGSSKSLISFWTASGTAMAQITQPKVLAGLLGLAPHQCCPGSAACGFYMYIAMPWSWLQPCITLTNHRL